MIPLCEPVIEGNEWKYIKQCLDTGWVSSAGSFVDTFEDKFKTYIQSTAAVVTINGTAALVLALQSLDIGEGDEIIVPSMTFIASVNPVKYVGAVPVFVDITPDTWLMNVDKIENLISSKTKAIIPVHLYGNMVDMEPLVQLARKHKLYVIEDATEALGAEYRTSNGVWHKAGTMGDFGVFSFNGNKLITTGAGGMLVTNNTELGTKAKYLSNQAKTVMPNGGFYHEDIGYNYRMPNILAAMGVAQLEKIEFYIEKKLENAYLYSQLLQNVDGIQLSVQKQNVKHVNWLYSILINESFGLNRDSLIEKLNQNGIMSRPFFEPIHNMKPYISSIAGDMKVTCEVSQKGINLPNSVSLEMDEIRYICDCIKRGSL